MRSQIDLLRQTILDLRQTEAQEVVSLRGKIDILEASLSEMSSRPGEQDIRPDDAKVTMENIVTHFKSLPVHSYKGDTEWLYHYVETRVSGFQYYKSAFSCLCSGLG